MLFEFLGPSQVSTAISMLLQEQSILVVSHSPECLTPICEALLSLIYPLQWPHAYIPVLPQCYLEYTEAPVPFLIGISSECLHYLQGSVISSICIINLDSGSVVPPLKDGTFFQLPRSLEQQQVSKWERLLAVELNNRTNDKLNVALRIVSLELVMELIGHFQVYKYSKRCQKRFLNECSPENQEYVQKLLSTNLWDTFSADFSRFMVAPNENGQPVARTQQIQVFCDCVEIWEKGCPMPVGDKANTVDGLLEKYEVLLLQQPVEEPMMMPHSSTNKLIKENQERNIRDATKEEVVKGSETQHSSYDAPPTFFHQLFSKKHIGAKSPQLLARNDKQEQRDQPHQCKQS
mmetsp:Transcript_40243/g.52985  ORF Transcript_40243/g.52985 Transcript_40243/m.52985 type:complete len:348 (+) Transcript_40243:346-1389(+)